MLRSYLYLRMLPYPCSTTLNYVYLCKKAPKVKVQIVFTERFSVWLPQHVRQFVTLLTDADLILLNIINQPLCQHTLISDPRPCARMGEEVGN